MEFPARNERHATQQETKMQRRKPKSNQLVLRFFLQEIMHREVADFLLPIADFLARHANLKLAIGNRQPAMANLFSRPSCE
jgi:hypothetical protein